MQTKYKKIFEEAWAMVAEDKPTKITTPSDCLPLLKKFRNQLFESFVVITLDGAHQVIKVHTISKGILNKAIIHPREVFRPAISDSSASVIVAHNHPSGKCEPSKEDRDLTFRLSEAGKLLGIEILDHIIVGLTGYHSFLEEGDM